LSIPAYEIFGDQPEFFHGFGKKLLPAPEWEAIHQELSNSFERV